MIYTILHMKRIALTYRQLNRRKLVLPIPHSSLITSLSSLLLLQKICLFPLLAKITYDSNKAKQNKLAFIIDLQLFAPSIQAQH